METLDNEPDKHLKRQSPFTSDSELDESDLSESCGENSNESDTFKRLEAEHKIIIKPDPKLEKHTLSQKRKGETDPTLGKKQKMTNDSLSNDNVSNDVIKVKMEMEESEDNDDEADEADEMKGFESDSNIMNIKLENHELNSDPVSETKSLNISDIISTGNLDLEKSVELSDIIDTSELSQDKSDSVQNDFMDQSNLDSSDEMKASTSKNDDDIDFDITEKLREMGEISVKPVKKGDSLLKRNESEDEVSVEIARKPADGDDEDGLSAAERKVGNLRRNIREVMDDQQLDAATLSAQRQEMERLARVQEQQRIIREVQRQIALNRQNNKTQTRVISLLQGNTSILKQGSGSGSGQRVSIPGTGTVLVKLPGKGAVKSAHDKLRTGTANITPSVSIAPVKAVAKPRTSEQGESSESESEEEVPTVPIKKGKKDVVQVVDSSSDDDCIMLSDDGEPDEEPEEDTQNSGLHVNDSYNIPDDQGRVVINIGHTETEEDIYLAPQISRVIKPHQVGGVRFLFDNIIESVERFDTSTGFGCILAHSMGLGKTLQLVCFCDIFLRHTSAKTVLCIMPINTLQNWMAEFNMWLPVESAIDASPHKLHGEVRPRNFNLHVLNDSHKTLGARAKVVQDWTRDGGVLLIGYELYRLLSLKKMSKKKKRRGKAPATSEAEDPEDQEANRKLLDEMHEALVKPGPDLVICDEGHRIKNSHASISLALKQIRSKRRIVLTGYPLQNNLQEYWCMVDFVRPNYLGTKTEFANMFERPIQNGQCIDSTPQDIRLMRYRAHVLHSLLVGFVQRRSHAVLQTSLPQKEEYVLLVRMTPFQRKLYDVFMNDVVRTKTVPNPLKAFAVCCKIWNHTDVLYHFLKKREAVDLDLDLEDGPDISPGTESEKGKRASPKKGRGRGGGNCKNSKKDKKGNSSQVQPFAPVCVGSKPAATITPNSSSAVIEEVATESSSSQSVFNTLQEQQKPGDMNVNPNDEMIPNEINTANDQKVPPEYPMQGNDQNYSYNNMPYQQYSQNSYYNQPLKDEYRNPQYGNPIQQYGGDGYNPYPQQGMTTYGPQQNYWNNQSSYYPNNLDYNNWNPDYTNNMYGGHSNTFDQQRPQENSYDNRYTGFENIKNEEIKHWGSENTPTYIKPEELKTDDVSKEEADPKLEDEKEDILELQPCVPPKANTCISTSDIIKKVSDDPDTVDSKNDTVDNDVKDKDVNDESDSVKDKDSFQADYQAVKIPSKEEAIPYDWAIELMKGYVAGIIENSAKMEIFFCILEESIKLGDRILVFSQSLFTLNLIEDFLHKNTVHGTEIHWAKNTNYYRLDGSTSALEREKLINEFNCNPNIHMFLVSTRAGSLGINLVGANRVIVFDASWNPCHDTQAVCRVYRYGQKKPCFVYRLVMDNCLEKKIYDRQINKQGMADRVVDECNPDAHLSMKEVTNLCWDDEQDSELSDFSQFKDKYRDSIMRKVVESHSHTLSKEPFQHESLLIDRKEKKLSQAEKRLAQRGYELEKKNASRPTYSYSSGTGLQYRTVRTPDGAIVHRPVASVRPMQADMGDRAGARQGGARPTRWIPAEVWQRQGMTAQEMTLPLDVVIPTSSAEKSNIVLKAGQKVMVLKSPKGIYMQLESGKIIAIRTAFKVGQGDTAKDGAQSTGPKKGIARSNLTKITAGPNLPGNLKNNTSITVIPSKQNMGQKSLVSKTFHKKIPLPQGKVNIIRTVGTDKNIQLGMARPYSLNRGKLQVKSVTRSIGSIPGVTKPLDSDSLTPNLDPSIQSDVTRPKEEKASDAVTAAEETTDNSNLSANDNSNASIANEESVFSETPSSTPVGTPASEQSSKDEKEVKTFSESNKDEEIDREPDEQNVKSNEFPSVEHKDSEQEENSKPDVNTTLESPKEVLSEDTLPTDTQSREKVIYKPHLVERRLKTTTQQKTSLKNYRHKSTHKRTLVSPSNATAAPTIPNMQESSLSRLEKTTSALGKEPNNRFQASLSNITRSYSPTNMEVPKYETTRPTQNALSKKVPTQKIPAPKFTNQNGDLDSEDSGRGTSSANSMRSTPATLTSLSDKSMDSFSGSNLQSSEPEKNAVNSDDKTSVISSNISTPNIPVGSPYDSSQQQSKPEVPYDSRNVGNEQFLNYGQPAADTNTNVPIAPAPPYPPYPGPGGCYPYPSNPPYEGMYPNYDPGYPPMFHGHSAFHRPEPLPVTVPIPGQEINTPSGYPLHPYPPPPGPHPGPYPVTQNVPGTPVINPQYPHGPPQSYPLHQSHYAGQNPVPNYPQNMNPYPGFSGQPLPPYSQFGGHYPSAPVNQPAYNTRPMYTPPDYSGSGYGSSGYPPYPPQPTPNQWGQ